MSKDLSCVTCNGKAKKTAIFLCLGCPGNECINCGECDCYCTCCRKHNEPDCDRCCSDCKSELTGDFWCKCNQPNKGEK